MWENVIEVICEKEKRNEKQYFRISVNGWQCLSQNLLSDIFIVLLLQRTYVQR